MENYLLEKKKRKPSLLTPKEVEPADKVLVVGGGGSYENNLEYARNFKGKIMVVEVMAMRLIKNGVMPDYIVTYEMSEGIMTECFTLELSDYSDNMLVFYNAKSKAELPNRLGRLRFARMPVRNDYGYVNNVGLFGVLIAKDILKAKEIHLIAFDHEGVGAHNQVYPEDMYEDWVTAFKGFIPYLNGTRIINATGKGRLYFEGIEKP